MTPQTPQEKIDEMHSILVQWDKSRKRQKIFSYIKQAIIWIFVLIIVFFPNLVIDVSWKIMQPIITKTINETLNSQKNNISEFWWNLSDKAKNIIENFSISN